MIEGLLTTEQFVMVITSYGTKFAYVSTINWCAAQPQRTHTCRPLCAGGHSVTFQALLDFVRGQSSGVSRAHGNQPPSDIVAG